MEHITVEQICLKSRVETGRPSFYIVIVDLGWEGNLTAAFDNEAEARDYYVVACEEYKQGKNKGVLAIVGTEMDNCSYEFNLDKRK